MTKLIIFLRTNASCRKNRDIICILLKVYNSQRIFFADISLTYLSIKFRYLHVCICLLVFCYLIHKNSEEVKVQMAKLKLKIENNLHYGTFLPNNMLLYSSSLLSYPNLYSLTFHLIRFFLNIYFL